MFGGSWNWLDGRRRIYARPGLCKGLQAYGTLQCGEAFGTLGNLRSGMSTWKHSVSLSQSRGGLQVPGL